MTTLRCTVPSADLADFIDEIESEGFEAMRRLEDPEAGVSIVDVPHLSPSEAIAAGATRAAQVASAPSG
ncbi:MAG: hypothetical protein ACE37F_26055 [Nannocystaceae bacterium]|nr:hypothetical protein [bacterium]